MLARPDLRQIAQQPTSGQVAQSERITAPVGGWNVYDSIAAMEPIYALTLINVFATARSCIVRSGYNSWATGMAGNVETLFVWGGPSQQKMLAANGGNIYDVTTTGAVGSPLSTGYTNARWQYVNFGTPGGEFIFACNGVDTPWNYNGIAISTSPAITGIDPTSIVNVCLFKERLFFTLNDTLTYAYLPVNQIGGAALTIDLSSFFPLGGKLMTIGTWSRAGLTQQEDLIVFITDKGEFLTFAGNDPADPANWALQNHGRMGAPVGRRCLRKIGSDLYIVSQDGLVALSEVLWLDRVDVSKTISQKIGVALNVAVSKWGNNFGWEPFLYPKGNLALVNVPITSGSNVEQYVVNTATGAWCQFQGLNANCWALYNEAPFFGSYDGKVYQWDSSNSDNGGNINWQARSAFLDMGISGQNKQWVLVRPIFNVNGNPSVNLDVEVDYNFSGLSAAATPSNPDSEWNTAVWNAATWAGVETVKSFWSGGNQIGRVVAIHMRGAAKGQTVEWLATDFTFIQGGLL